MAADVQRYTLLRTARLHLAAQVEAGVDTTRATRARAREALASVEAELAGLEPGVRATPEAAYLFAGARKRRGTGRTPVPVPCLAGSPSPSTGEEDKMARKSNASALEETLLALRRAEKSAGSTKWALEGAGAKRNPPSAERKKALKAKLAGETALVAELRAKRDGLRAEAA